jgi:integrase
MLRDLHGNGDTYRETPSTDPPAATVDAYADDGWSRLSAHDLRRTWGTLLVDDEVEPGLVMEWGGWEDWETFREAYLGTYSTKAKTRARAKVDWL